MKKGFQFVLQTKYVPIFAEPKDCLGGVQGAPIFSLREKMAIALPISSAGAWACPPLWRRRDEKN